MFVPPILKKKSENLNESRIEIIVMNFKSNFSDMIHDFTVAYNCQLAIIHGARWSQFMTVNPCFTFLRLKIKKTKQLSHNGINKQKQTLIVPFLYIMLLKNNKIMLINTPRNLLWHKSIDAKFNKRIVFLIRPQTFYSLILVIICGVNVWKQVGFDAITIV